MKTAILLQLTFLGSAWPACVPSGIIPAAPGVTPPRLVSRAEPEYTLAAREAQVQGTVVLQLVVGEDGKPADICVLSPLGFGLDERAREAVDKWRFLPAKKAGNPVRMRASVEVNFRLPGSWFDDKAESRRTRFNLALQALRGHDAHGAGQALKTIQDLARQEYPGAMDLLGRLLNAGQYVDKDPERGLILISKAAEKNYAPAVFDLGVLYLEGSLVPRDAERGLGLIHDAAVMGSAQAQYLLGQRYESGGVLPRDSERARHFFRLCAARGDSKCQLRLGKLLLDQPQREERDYVQALAWLQLAADRGNGEARRIAEAEVARITEVEENWISQLKAELLQAQ